MADLNVAIRIAAEDRASGPLGAIHKSISSLAGAPSKAVGGLVDGLGKLGLAGMGLSTLVQGVGGLATGMVAGNAQMETYETQLGTLMGSADAAKDRLKELADFGAKTPFELPEIAAAEKVLLGFGLTGQKAIELTGKSGAELRTVIGDIAAGTGASFEEIALNFGKFSAGATGESISRLQELGVVTREQMAEMGVEFSKSGELISPLPEAMSVAVQIANSKFGGGMDKLSNTFEGQMSTLSDNFNQAKNVITQPIFDALKQGVIGLNNVLSNAALQDKFKEISSVLGTTVSGAVRIAQQALGGDFKGALGALRTSIQDMLPVIRAQLMEWGQAFIEWISPMIPPLLDAMVEFEREWFAWLGAQVAPLMEQLASWAAAFIDWIGPQIPPFLRELGHLIEAGFNWIVAQLPGLGAKLAQWGAAFIEWIEPRIPPMLAELGSLLLELGGWLIGTALPAIISKLSEWGAAFIGWVARDVLPNLPGALANIAAAIAGWIGDVAPQIGAWAVDMGSRLVSGFLAGLGGLAGQLKAGIENALASIHIDLKWFTFDGINGPSFHISAPSIPTPSFSAPSAPSLPAPSTPFTPGASTPFLATALSHPGESGPGGVWDAARRDAGLDIQTFATGGVVAGPLGSAQLAIVHGGERVIPSGRGMGAVTINLIGGTYLGDDRTLVRNLARILKPDLDRVVQLQVV